MTGETDRERTGQKHTEGRVASGRAAENPYP